MISADIRDFSPHLVFTIVGEIRRGERRKGGTNKSWISADSNVFYYRTNNPRLVYPHNPRWELQCKQSAEFHAFPSLFARIDANSKGEKPVDVRTAKIFGPTSQFTVGQFPDDNNNVGEARRGERYGYPLL